MQEQEERQDWLRVLVVSALRAFSIQRRSVTGAFDPGIGCASLSGLNARIVIVPAQRSGARAQR